MTVRTYNDGQITLILGDCLDILPTLEAGSVDAVVTDPPYGINTKSDGSGKLNPWADLCNSALWYRHWLAECRRIAKFVWSCLNWRSLATFQKAACDIGWPIESLLIWDKCWIGPGGSRGLRPSYEMVALWCGENASISDRGLPDIQRFPWSSQKPTGHPAEKPVDLMAWCVNAASASSVCDPFMGSGTTAIACIRAGLSFVGIESDEGWFASACRRIEAELNRHPLFEATTA